MRNETNDTMHDDLDSPFGVEVQAVLTQGVAVPLGLRTRVEARVFAALRDRDAHDWRGRVIVASAVFATLSPRLGLLPGTTQLAPATLLLGPALCALGILVLVYARLIDEAGQSSSEERQ